MKQQIQILSRNYTYLKFSVRKQLFCGIRFALPQPRGLYVFVTLCIHLANDQDYAKRMWSSSRTFKHTTNNISLMFSLSYFDASHVWPRIRFCIMFTREYYFRRVGFSLFPFGPTQNISILMESQYYRSKAANFDPSLIQTTPSTLYFNPLLKLAVPAKQFKELDH